MNYMTDTLVVQTLAQVREYIEEMAMDVEFDVHYAGSTIMHAVNDLINAGRINTEIQGTMLLPCATEVKDGVLLHGDMSVENCVDVNLLLNIIKFSNVTHIRMFQEFFPNSYEVMVELLMSELQHSQFYIREDDALTGFFKAVREYDKFMSIQEYAKTIRPPLSCYSIRYELTIDMQDGRDEIYILAFDHMLNTQKAINTSSLYMTLFDREFEIVEMKTYTGDDCISNIETLSAQDVALLSKEFGHVTIGDNDFVDQRAFIVGSEDPKEGIYQDYIVDLDLKNRTFKFKAFR